MAQPIVLTKVLCGRTRAGTRCSAAAAAVVSQVLPPMMCVLLPPHRGSLPMSALPVGWAGA